jgi:hypothetical protein
MTHEEIEALDPKAVTEEDEEIPAEQMRHRIFRIEHPDDARRFVGSVGDSTHPQPFGRSSLLGAHPSE